MCIEYVGMHIQHTDYMDTSVMQRKIKINNKKKKD